MIRTSFFSLALLGLLFSNVALATPSNGEIQCKVEQDEVTTALFLQGMLTQTYRACSKGSIASLDVVAAVEFNGGYVSVAIMDENNILRAIKTFTADNYNGTSMYLDNLAIPTLRNNTFNIVIKTFDGSSCVLPCTDNEDMFVGEMKVGSTAESKNLKFTSAFRGASSNLQNADGSRGNSDEAGHTSAHSRVAASLDLTVEGDCNSAQRKSTGVLNFESETVVQMFKACDRGRISQIKLAVPFVEPGYDFEYALLRADYTPIASGEFTHENTTDGELLLTFDEGSVRKDEPVFLKIVCPVGARMAVLADGSSDSSFGRLYVDGQATPFNLAMAAGLNAATASHVQATTEGRDDIQVGIYPVPFGNVLNVSIRGALVEGALLQLLDHQGKPLQQRYLAGGSLDKPLRLNDLSSLRPGLYTIRLVSGDHVVTKRILKG